MHPTIQLFHLTSDPTSDRECIEDSLCLFLARANSIHNKRFCKMSGYLTLLTSWRFLHSYEVR